MNRSPRKSPRHPEPRTIARIATVALLTAAVIGAPAAAASAKSVVDTPKVLGYGSGV